MLPVTILILLSLIYLAFQQSCPKYAASRPAFLLFTLSFLALVLSPVALGWLASFMAAGYVFVFLGVRFPQLHPAWLIGPLVILFAVFKRYDIIPLPQVYGYIPEIVGLSYIIFRIVMAFFDARANLRTPDVVTYLNFCLSPFTFLSGPVQRLRDFRDDMERRKNFHLQAEEGAVCLTRIMNGVIKVLFIGPFIQNFQPFFLNAAEKDTVVMVLHDMSAPTGYGLAALCYLLFLYFNFSGYTDIVIGLGRMLGFCLPENFDRPFAATSFLDFWNRWHISLSLWFRDYCFTPVLKQSVRMGIKNPVIATMPAYFISFGLLGLWHGRTWPFFLCGFMFAVGSVLNHLYRTLVVKKLGKERMGRLNRNLIWQALTSAVTSFYIAIAITGLWRTGPEFIATLQPLTPVPTIIAAMLVTFCLAVGIFALRALLRMPMVQNLSYMPLARLFVDSSSFMIALKVFLVILWYFTFSTNLPDFVYRGF